MIADVLTFLKDLRNVRLSAKTATKILVRDVKKPDISS